MAVGRPIHPGKWFPGSLAAALTRGPDRMLGIKRQSTAPTLASAVTTALRYRTLIEPGPGFQVDLRNPSKLLPGGSPIKCLKTDIISAPVMPDRN